MRVDAVVVGGGIAGAAAAWALSEHLAVVLLERESSPGHHATGRSASVLSETSGHHVVCALARASRPFFEKPPEGFCEGALLSRRGLMWVGRVGDAAALDQFAIDAARMLPDIQRLTPSEAARRLVGFRDDAVAGGAVYEPSAMSIDTATFLQSLLSGTKRRGGVILASSEAISGTPTSVGWNVSAGPHTIETTHIVNAAGAWGDAVATRCGVASIDLRPLRRTAAIIPAPDWVNAWPVVMDIAGRYYLEPEAGGLLISPADETESTPCDARPEELDVALALERVGEATELSVRRVRSAWAGLRTFAPDRAPVLGQDPEASGFWWLVGQGGAGIKTAPAMASLLAAQIVGCPRPSLWQGNDADLAPARFR